MPQEKSDAFFTELLKFVLIAAAIVVPLRLFVAQPFIVSGASMEPTFLNGQYLVIDELTYHFNDPQRGDVIIFRYPKDPSQFFIKRIVGLPGEKVLVRSGKIEIQKADGTMVPLGEPYVVNQGDGPDADYAVAANDYFVMGDNRPESSDSRSWGLLPRGNIVGRAILRLLPINTLSVFPGSTKSN